MKVACPQVLCVFYFMLSKHSEKGICRLHQIARGIHGIKVKNPCPRTSLPRTEGAGSSLFVKRGHVGPMIRRQRALSEPDENETGNWGRS